MQTRMVTTFGDVNGPPDKLRNLREEAMVRLQSLRHRPDPKLLPRSLLQLRDDQKHALVVDAKRSRLYVYENRSGQLKFVADYYISQGKLGVNKLKAGDQKTPIGIYYITSHLSGARLPDFYGSVWHEQLTKVLLGGAAAWMLIGNMIMFKMVNFKI